MPSLKFNQVTKTLPRFTNLIPRRVGVRKNLTALFSLPLMMPRNIDVVYVGASIMNNSVKDSSSRGTIEAALRAEGFEPKVHDKATSGWTTTDILASLNAGALDEFLPSPKSTFVVLHAGGNDVSGSGPYPGGADLLESNLEAILSLLTGNGFQVMLSPLTYRIPPSSNPTAPYNTNIIIPLIHKYTPWWLVNNEPQFDLYEATFNNQDWIDVDGVHMSWSPGRGALRTHIVDTFNTNVKVTPTPLSGYVEDMLIHTGSSGVTIDDFYVNLSSGSPTSTDLRNHDGSVITEGSSITISSGSEHNSGKSVSANTTNSLYNSSIIERGMFSSTGMTIGLDQAGLDPLGDYVVKITSSRDDPDTSRVSLYTVGGETKEQLAIADIPEVVYFNVSGQDLMDGGIQVTKKSGSPYCYINGVTIHRQ